MPEIRDLLEEGTAEGEGGLSFVWDEGEIEVQLGDGRTQTIRYELREGRWHFVTRVAGSRVVQQRGIDEMAQELLLRNAKTSFVTFGLDKRRRVIAWAEHPAGQVQAEELRLILTALALEADRYEWELTGRDAH